MTSRVFATAARPAAPGSHLQPRQNVVQAVIDAMLRLVLAATGLVAEGEDRCLDAVLQAEFGEDAADVGLDGLLADRQVPGDLPVWLVRRRAHARLTHGHQTPAIPFL